MRRLRSADDGLVQKLIGARFLTWPPNPNIGDQRRTVVLTRIAISDSEFSHVCSFRNWPDITTGSSWLLERAFIFGSRAVPSQNSYRMNMCGWR